MCSLCPLPVAKNHNFGQILAFWGLLYRLPFTDEGQIWCAIADHGIRLPAKFPLDRFILSSCGGENPNFCRFLPFFGLQHLVMSPSGINLRKLSTDAQLQTFPYPTASKSFLYCNAFMAKSGADGQINRQTNRKKLNILGHPGGG